MASRNSNYIERLERTALGSANTQALALMEMGNLAAYLNSNKFRGEGAGELRHYVHVDDVLLRLREIQEVIAYGGDVFDAAGVDVQAIHARLVD